MNRKSCKSKEYVRKFPLLRQYRFYLAYTIRYHYHTIPLCLLSEMGSWVPPDGTAYLFEKAGSRAQRAHWPPLQSPAEKPSPFLGVALDGFSIYGPYAQDGKLQLGPSAGGNATLGECNFDFETKRYHLTPNPPYVPDCWVGAVDGPGPHGEGGGPLRFWRSPPQGAVGGPKPSYLYPPNVVICYKCCELCVM